jgi:hypothetical protein
MLILIFLPALYSIWFKVRPAAEEQGARLREPTASPAFAISE